MFAKYRAILISYLLMIIMGCAAHTGKISGTVHRKAGNQMPSPDAPVNRGEPFQTWVCFFELSNLKKATATAENGLFSAIGTPLVKEIQTDRYGKFNVRLQPGTYSVLLKKDKLYYSNITDMNGNINPIRIDKGGTQNLKMFADWDATY